jgi:site-specific DNA-cytosine methylase
MLFFTKAKRAQNVNDYESWNEGGVAPTLNAMDNNGEAYATVLIVGVDIYNADISDKSFQTIKAGGGITSMPSVLIIDGTRVNDVRVYEDGIVPTVISRYGTGGGNVPMVFDNSEAILNKMQGFGDYKESKIGGTLKISNSTAQDLITSTSIVRRLTPVECERLQGFPDNWTDGQADSNRYKQMGNAVAVPVVQWIIDRMVAE